jgi:hypothetical protein
MVIGESSDNPRMPPNDGKPVEREGDQQVAVAREQARLVELAHDSIIVRDLREPNHVLEPWSRSQIRVDARRSYRTTGSRFSQDAVLPAP